MLTRPEADTGNFTYVQLLARVKLALAEAVEVAVPAAEIRRFPGQPREYFDLAALARLSESIDASGQTTPGIIRRAEGAPGYELVDGERRWRAVQMIPADRRPLYRARLIASDDAVVQYLISGIANFNREGHAPLEVSDAIARMMGLDLPAREIAALLGLSEQWVYQMHGLCRLDGRVRAMLDPALPKKERLPTSAAVEIAKCAHSLQYSLAQRVLRRDVTLSGLRAEVVERSRAVGAPIRTRRADPNRRWRSVVNSVGHIERVARDMEASLGAPGVRGLAVRRPAHERALAEKNLRGARAVLERCAAVLAAWVAEGEA